MTRSFEAKASPDGKDVEMLMFGIIGRDYTGDGSRIDANTVAKVLSANKSAKTIRLQVNSEGGDAYIGLAIYSLLKNHGAKIVGTIHGIAASAMTVVLAACDEVVMNEAGAFMIHEARTGVTGTADEIQLVADITKSLNDKMAGLYAARSGKPKDAIVQMMHAETWMTAEEAKANGFVNTISPMKTVAATLQTTTTLNVPEHFKPILAKLRNEVTTMPESTTSTLTALATEAATEAANARATAIFSACLMAGQPQLAAGFVTDPKATAESVLVAMQNHYIAHWQSSSLPGSGASEPPRTGKEVSFAGEFKANEDIFLAQGISEEQYVKSRAKSERVN